MKPEDLIQAMDDGSMELPQSFELESSLKSTFEVIRKSAHQTALADCEVYDEGQVKVTKASSASVRRNGEGELDREDYRATDDELASINSKSLVTVKKNDIYVFTLRAFDTLVDRAWEHFLPAPAPVFAQAAVLFPWKTWVTDHEWKIKHEIGRIMDAWVEGSGEDSKLMLKVYISDIPENQQFLTNLFNGIHFGVSVGFLTPLWGYLCDSCNKGLIKAKSTDYSKFVSIFNRKVCPHKPGTKDEDGDITTVSILCMSDAMEITSCPVPAQRASAVQQRGDKKSMSEQEKPEITNEAAPEVVTEEPKVELLELLKSASPELLAQAKEMLGVKEAEKPADNLESKGESNTADTISSEINNKDFNSVPDHQFNKPENAGNPDPEYGASNVAESMSAEQEQIPVQDTPAAAPTNDGGASSSDLSSFDTHGLKESIDDLRHSTAGIVSKMAEYGDMLNGHKSALEAHTNALAEHMKCMKEMLPVSEGRGAIAPATSFTAEQLSAAEKSTKELEDKYNELVSFTEDLIKEQAKFLQKTQSKGTVAKKSWAEEVQNAIKTLGGEQK